MTSVSKLLALCALGALLIAGCGSGSGGAGAQQTTTMPPAPALKSESGKPAAIADANAVAAPPGEKTGTPGVR